MCAVKIRVSRALLAMHDRTLRCKALSVSIVLLTRTIVTGRTASCQSSGWAYHRRRRPCLAAVIAIATLYPALPLGGRILEPTDKGHPRRSSQQMGATSRTQGLWPLASPTKACVMQPSATLQFVACSKLLLPSYCSDVPLQTWHISERQACS